MDQLNKENVDQLRVGCLYIRVSTTDQEELSPDAQKRLLLDYAKSNHIVVPDEFIFEESVSGRNAQKRPKFQQMIALAKSNEHPVDVVLVWKFSRFARNQEESIVYKSMLRKDHVDVISVSEPLVDGPFGSLIERIIEWMDEYYSIRLSGEVLRGMKQKALNNGYQTVPCLGYDSVGKGKPFIINEEDFKIVSYIMDQYDNHNMDPTAIARKCNEIGYRTRRGGLFERRNIEYILRNPFYCGIVEWNGITFEGTHEVRYTREQYEARIKLMDSRKPPKRHRNVSACQHWLSGLIKCSVCGATLSYNYNKQCSFFQCWKYAKGFHKQSSSISVNKMEKAVIEYLGLILRGEESVYIRRNPKSTIDNTDEIKALNRELDRISTKEMRVKDAYENGIDSLQEYKENRIRLNEQRQNITKQLQVLNDQAAAQCKSESEIMKDISNAYKVITDPTADFEAKGTSIRTVVDQIIFDRKTGNLFFDIKL